MRKSHWHYWDMRALEATLSLVLVFVAACSDGKAPAAPAGDAAGGDAALAGAGGNDATLMEAGGSEVKPALMCRPQSEDTWHLAGTSADGSVRFVLNRCAGNPCGGGCNIGEVYFAVTHGGRTDAARGSSVAYSKTHHNFNDSLVATLSDRLLKWRVVLDERQSSFTRKHYVRVDTAQGAPILPETEVTISECSGLLGCF